MSTSSMLNSRNLRRRRAAVDGQRPLQNPTGTDGAAMPDRVGRAWYLRFLAVALSISIAISIALRASVIQSQGLPSIDIPEKKERNVHETPPLQFNRQRDSCRIYMAPSSAKGVRGYGVYTTQSISPGELILNGPDGPDILVTDFDYFPRDSLRSERRAWIEVFDSYWWGRGVADQITYESESSIDFQITFGSLPNHHCVLSSVDHRWPDPPYDDTLVEARKDPGAGAFSYHMGRNFFSMSGLDAGDEIFLNYGYCGENQGDEVLGKDEERPGQPDAEPAWTASIPKTPDFEAAANIATLMFRRLEKRQNSQQTTIDSLFNLLYKSFVENRRDSISDQTVALLPKSSQELMRIMALRKDDSRTEVARCLAKELGTQSRSVEWIIENGLCVENLLPGPSRLPHAGQGAIAQFPLTKGETIVPAPLLQIIDRDVLATYDHRGEKVGTQLLMNYCFGHRDSSILLCPDTNAILINHCSTRQKECEPRGPNAKVQWASWEKDNDRWLQMPLQELGTQRGRGLAINIVATRDIYPGEEVFIDYGKDWEDAWITHKKNWNVRKPDLVDAFPSIKELNENRGPLSLLISGNPRKQVDHPNVFTGCSYWWTEEDDNPIYTRENPGWRDLPDEQILETYSGDGDQFRTNYTNHLDGTFWPCTVIRPEDETGTRYTVRIHQAHFEEDFMPWDENDLPRLLTNFPRSSIHYFRQPYTSDQHLPQAFRHPIGIPDEMFPEQWKNRRELRR